MSNSIERLNYYEREYLRSFDFIAEQNYHMEMRRRLNLALHLWGIVDGLEVLKGVLTPGLPEQVYISPGMAIDAFGREFVLFAPYALSDDDLVANRISGSGNYKIWIVYRREPATPPAPGYRVCDINDQYTRWRESYAIFIPNDPTYTGPDPKAVPGPAVSLSDDPVKVPWPVRLGTVTVGNVDGKLTITNAASEERVYIGARAQRIITPHVTPANPPVDATLSKITPLDAPLSLGIEANVFAEKNLIVGENFEIDKNKITPLPAPIAPATFPSPTGNLKVASDLFLQGNLYAKINDEWLGLGEYLKTFIPEVQIGVKTITPVPNTDPSEGDDTIAVTTTLPKVTRPSLVVALSSVTWISMDNFNTWSSGVDQAAALVLDVSVPGQPSVNGRNYAFPIHWKIGPRLPEGVGQPAMLNVQSLAVSYIAVFYP